MPPDPGVVAFVRAALPPRPVRVLEVGASRGELAAALRAAGYDVVAIDQAADGAPGVEPVALADLDADEAEFAAAVAGVSLRHVEPLVASCERLAEVVRPGGRLVVDEFDVDRFDERAANWQAAQRAAAGLHIPRDPPHSPPELREHLHPLADIRAALRPAFSFGEPVRGAYLYRWDLDPGLRAVEERLVADGALPATGARLVGIRR